MYGDCICCIRCFQESVHNKSNLATEAGYSLSDRVFFIGEHWYFVSRRELLSSARDNLGGGKVILLPLLLLHAVFSKANLVIRASPQPGAAELGKISSYDPVVQATGLQGDYIRCYG